MKKEFILAIGTLVGGLLFSGYATTTTLDEPLSSICIVLGILFFVAGFIWLILIIKKYGRQRQEGDS